MPLRSKTTGQSKALKKKKNTICCAQLVSIGKLSGSPTTTMTRRHLILSAVPGKTHNLKGFCANQPSLPGEELILPRQHASHHSANVLLETCPRKTAQVLRMFKG